MTTVSSAFRRAAVPLTAYYLVTLVLPLANGAAQSGAPFLEHALIVIVVPPTLIILACAVHSMSASRGRLRRYRHEEKASDP
jgi:hypothetical protein